VNDARARIAALPGVERASLTNVLPLTYQTFNAETFRRVDDPEATSGTRVPGTTPLLASIDPDFLNVIDVRVLRGRGITSADVPGSVRAIVIDTAFARRFWPDADAVGQQLVALVRSAGPGSVVSLGDRYTVVGVVAPINMQGEMGDHMPTAFLSLRQSPDSERVSIVVRASGNASRLASSIRQELMQVDPHLPIGTFGTLASIRDSHLARYLTASRLAMAFSALALVLCCVGVYAIIAFAARQRTREIGIRLALGARRVQIVGLFFRQGMRVALIGVAIGLVLGRLAVAGTVAMMMDIQMPGAATYVVISAVLLAVAALASWLPARRAAATDPLETLRQE
jgi:putative ABC transport system permease protein